jgi:hypothetical protein
MLLELEAGLRVDVFWPGTGPIVPEERSALKQLLIGSTHYFPNTADHPFDFGSGGGLTRTEFLADDSVDPCLHRLDDTQCIGGHIVSMGSMKTNHWFTRLPCNAFEYVVQFSQLRTLKGRFEFLPSFAYTCAPNERVLIPCSFWQLKELAKIDWWYEPFGDGVEEYGATTRFHFEKCPEDIGAMPNLVIAELIALDATGALPARLFQSPKLEVLMVEDIVLGSLPSLELMPNLKSLRLVNNNISLKPVAILRQQSTLRGSEHPKKPAANPYRRNSKLL